MCGGGGGGGGGGVVGGGGDAFSKAPVISFNYKILTQIVVSGCLAEIASTPFKFHPDQVGTLQTK